MSEKISRRGFLKRFAMTAAGLAVGATAAQTMERIAGELPAERLPVSGEGQWIAVVDPASGEQRGTGRIVAIEGNTITVQWMPSMEPGDIIVRASA